MPTDPSPSPAPAPAQTAGEAFRRVWLLNHARFTGPPTLVFGLWLCHQVGWSGMAIAGVALYTGFNYGWTVLEERGHPATLRPHIRAAANLLTLTLLFSQVGAVPGAWVLLIPAVFGGTGAAHASHTRIILGMCLGGMVLGSALGGVYWGTIGLELAGLLLVAAVAGRLYEPLISGVIAAQVREAALKEANDKLTAALQARKLFLATMSHEIRTPLNGMLGMATLLGDTPLDDEQQEMLGVIRRSGDGLTQVINDILDISKLEAGRVGLERRPTDVGQLAREVVALLRHAGLRPGVSLELQLDNLPDSLSADPTRLRQVLLNLVGNACKFTPAGSVRVRLAWQQDVLQIDVVDTGIGIPASALPTLFTPFVQADASITRHFGGTGLGLSICRRLADLMDGELRVESTVGEGSTFTFVVPATSASTSTGPETASPPTARATACQVLLVDDNDVNLLVATAMLERYGCRVTTAQNGREALLALGVDPSLPLPDSEPSTAAAAGATPVGWSPDGGPPSATDIRVVFLDCRMPVMDGFAACRRLRAAGWTRPILALTAGVTPDEQDLCRAAGMDDIIAKPLRMDVLGQVLQRWLPPEEATRPGTDATDDRESAA